MAARSSIKKSVDTKAPAVVEVETTIIDPGAIKPSAVCKDADDSVFETKPAQREVFKVRNVFDPHTTVIVRNGFQGKLIYKSRRTGESYVWHEFGDEQEMEIQELRNAKGTSKAFFSENWFLFDDPEVIDYLGVSAYYKNALTYDEFDELFDLSIDDMVARIKNLSAGQRKSVVYRAAQMIDSGAIDSRKKIDALEKALGIELVER